MDDASPAGPPLLLDAPLSRRRDHAVTALAGLLGGAISALFIEMLVVDASSTGSPVILALGVVGLAAAQIMPLLLSGRLSSLGIMMSAVAHLLGAGAAAYGLSSPLIQVLIPGTTEQMLLTARPAAVSLMVATALLTAGGAAATRVARRRGRAQALADVALAAHDDERDRIPLAPPSRRFEHLISLPMTAGCLAVTLSALAPSWVLLPTVPASQLEASSHSVQASTTATWLYATALLLAALSAGAVAASSTLGARVLGPLMVLCGAVTASLPSQHPLIHALGIIMGEQWRLPMLLGVALMSLGVCLIAVGWCVHEARVQGRDAQARATSSATSSRHASSVTAS